MLGVVQAQAADGASVFWGERGEEESDVGDLVGEGVGAEDVAADDAGAGSLGEVGDIGWEDGVAVVGAAVAGEEADEALEEGGGRLVILAAMGCHGGWVSGEGWRGSRAYGERWHCVIVAGEQKDESV